MRYFDVRDNDRLLHRVEADGFDYTGNAVVFYKRHLFAKLTVAVFVSPFAVREIPESIHSLSKPGDSEYSL